MKIIFDIIEFQSGNSDSILRLINKFLPLLKKYSRKLSYEDAYDDLLVDFIEIICDMKIEKMRNTEEGSIVTYICTSIHSSYIKRLKQLLMQKKVVPFAGLSESELYYVTGLISTEDFHNDFYFDLLKEYITPSEYTVIKMLYYYGYSISDIANYLKISRQAVNQMKIRSLEKLKKEMAL